MLFLSDAALRFAVEICLEKEKYRVCIAIPDPVRRMDIFRRVVEKATLYDFGAYKRQLPITLTLEFSNGSIIKVIQCSDSARGHICNLLIADPSITRPVLLDVLRPLERGDWIEYNERHRAEEANNGGHNTHDLLANSPNNDRRLVNNNV